MAVFILTGLVTLYGATLIGVAGVSLSVITM